MSTTERTDEPWWASGADDLDDADPLDRHRRARGGGGADDGPPDAWWHDAAELLGRVLRESSRPRNGPDRGGGPGDDRAHRHDPEVCGVCPLCAGLRALGEARPDLVVHLSEAARHLALAVKTIVDAHAGTLDGHDRLERIDLDEE